MKNAYWETHQWSWRDRIDEREHSDAYPVVFQCDNCGTKSGAWVKKGVPTTGVAVGVECKYCGCPTISAHGLDE